MIQAGSGFVNRESFAPCRFLPSCPYFKEKEGHYLTKWLLTLQVSSGWLLLSPEAIKRTDNPAQGGRYQRCSLLADLKTVLSLDLVILLFYGIVYWTGFILQLRTKWAVFNFSALSGSGSTSDPPRLVKDTWARLMFAVTWGLKSCRLIKGQPTYHFSSTGFELSSGNCLSTSCVQPWTGQRKVFLNGLYENCAKKMYFYYILQFKN